MKILHISPRYWPCWGGAEQHLQELSERLVRDGHQVTVATTNAGSFEYFWDRGKDTVPGETGAHDGVHIRRFPVRHLPAMPLAYRAIRRALTVLSTLPVDTTALLFALASVTPWVPGLARWLRTTDEGYDLVAAMNICYESLWYPAFRFARRRNIPFLVYPLTHLGEPESDQLRKYYTMRHQLELSRKSDGVFAQTDIERRYLVGQGVSPDKIVRAGPGVNPGEVQGGVASRFRETYSIEGPIVFSLGTLAHDKGTVHTVEAMRSLWERGVSATLVLCGSAVDQFDGYFRQLPVSVRERCRLLGFVPNQDKKDLLAAGDVMVMPSRVDSLGIVYLESWLYEKPVIGAAAGGVPEVISDGEDGFLVRFGDVAALTDRIATLLADPGLRAEMGRRGREKVLARYTWDAIFGRVRPVYERAAQKRVKRVAKGEPA